MELIENTLLVKWGARLFLIVVIICFIWWILSKKRNLKYKKYIYSGIKKYYNSDLITIKKNQTFKKQKQKRINKTEEMCRKIIQQIYNKPFPSVRPDFLQSPMTKKNLEIDCYNSELKIGLEYNGCQHYNYNEYFHKTKKNFYSQVHRDDWKRNKCKELGIRLIEIPYWVTPVDLKDYIIRELKKKQCL